MTQAITIRDEATPALKALRDEIGSKRVNAQIGVAVKVLVQKNFLGRPANKEGFPSSHFWGDAANKTNYQADLGGVTVSVNKVGVRQRLQGGPIRPREGKTYLTIPAIGAAYGHRAGEFSNLKFTFAVNQWGKMQPALVEAEATRVSFGRKKKDGSRTVKVGDAIRGDQAGGLVYFWLTKEVNQQPDPTVIPSDEAIEATALERVRSTLARFWERGGRA